VGREFAATARRGIAPLGGIDVGDGLGKTPAVADEVFDVALTLAVRVIGGFA